MLSGATSWVADSPNKSAPVRPRISSTIPSISRIRARSSSTSTSQSDGVKSPEKFDETSSSANGRELFAVAPDDQNAAQHVVVEHVQHACRVAVPPILTPHPVRAVDRPPRRRDRGQEHLGGYRAILGVDELQPFGNRLGGLGRAALEHPAGERHHLRVGVEEVHLVVANEGEELVTGRSQALHRFLIGM